jgi:hypothetical protein
MAACISQGPGRRKRRGGALNGADLKARETTMRRTILTTASLLAPLLAVGAGAAAAQGGMGPMMGGDERGIEFVAIDTDGNGSLSRAELQARAVARLGRIDESGDGMLTREELILAMPGPHGGMMSVFAADPGERSVDRLLALMGATEAGQVELDALADRRVNMLLAFVDTDRDAAISEAEAAAMREHGRRHRGGDGRGRDRDDGDGE